METVYLIEKGWIDPLENHNADGYKPFGFMLNEEDSKSFCDSKGYWTKKDCWSINFYKGGKMPKYKYKKLNLIK
jgi:hypothetical protein